MSDGTSGVRWIRGTDVPTTSAHKFHQKRILIEMQTFNSSPSQDQ